MKTTVQINEETKKALNFLAKRNILNDYCDQITYFSILTDYIDNKGEKYLQALAGYYLWVINNENNCDKQTRLLTSTFAHDLGQQKDEWMEPRSGNYLNFWTNRDF